MPDSDIGTGQSAFQEAEETKTTGRTETSAGRSVKTHESLLLIGISTSSFVF